MALDPTFVDFYSLLDVSSSAGAGAIRKAYLLAARASHPDKNPGDAEAAARFDAVKQAADVLLDSAKRAEYDTRHDRYIAELARREAMAAEARAMQEALEQREAQAAAASQEAAPWTAHAANRADVAAARADWEAYKESLQEQQHAAEAAARRAAGPLQEAVTTPQASPAPGPAPGMDATAKVKWSRDIAARYGFSQPGQGLGGLTAQELLLTMLRAVFKAPAQVASATLVKKRAAIVQFSDRRQAVAAAANPPAGFSVSLTVPLGPHAGATEAEAPGTAAASADVRHPAGTTPPAASGQAAPQAAQSGRATVPPPPAAAGLTSEQVALAARMVQAREAALFAWLDRQAPHES